MRRRDFISLAGSGVVLGAAPSCGGLRHREGEVARQKHSVSSGNVQRIAGLPVPELRRRYQRELFEEYLPFFDRHAVDHELGGWMCFLRHDGSPVSTNKFHWFQGRGILIHSYIYNHLDRDARLLDDAKRSLDFMLRHFPQPDGWWAAEVTREGDIVQPFAGDPFGLYYGIEGMQELAWATDDRELARQSIELFKTLFVNVHNPRFVFGLGLGDPHEAQRGLHGANTFMMDLHIATQMLRRWSDPGVSEIADRAVDALMNHYYNAELGILNEYAYADFTKRDEDVTKSNLGHGIEIMWMVMEEAQRRGDPTLYQEAKRRMRRHLDLGWDHIHGGISEWINVDQGCHDWGPASPRGSGLTFHGMGEYMHIKPLWAVNEAVVGCLMAITSDGDAWAMDYLTRCQRVLDEKFSLKPHGYPLHMMFCDRRISYIADAGRKPNYHHPRMLAKSLMLMDHLIASTR